VTSDKLLLDGKKMEILLIYWNVWYWTIESFCNIVFQIR